MYSSWDMVVDGCNYFLFWTIFCLFISLTAWKIKMKKKNEKKKKPPGDFIILHSCTKNYNQMIYGSWVMVRDRCSYFSFFNFIFNLSSNILTTTSWVTSSLSSYIPWINKQFLLEYCSWSSLTLFFFLLTIFSEFVKFFWHRFNGLCQIGKLFVAFNLHDSCIIAKIMYLWYFHF